MANLSVSVVEPKQELIECCKKAISKVNRIKMPIFYHSKLEDAYMLPPQQFKIALMEAVLGFIEHKKIALDNLASSLIPNGLVCVNDFFYREKPDTDIINYINNMIMSHFIYYTAEDIIYLFTNSGFECMQWIDIPLEKSLTRTIKQKQVKPCETFDNLLNLFNTHKTYLKSFLAIFKKV